METSKDMEFWSPTSQSFKPCGQNNVQRPVQCGVRRVMSDNVCLFLEKQFYLLLNSTALCQSTSVWLIRTEGRPQAPKVMRHLVASAHPFFGAVCRLRGHYIERDWNVSEQSLLRSESTFWDHQSAGKSWNMWNFMKLPFHRGSRPHGKTPNQRLSFPESRHKNSQPHRGQAGLEIREDSVSKNRAVFQVKAFLSFNHIQQNLVYPTKKYQGLGFLFWPVFWPLDTLKPKIPTICLEWRRTRLPGDKHPVTALTFGKSKLKYHLK